MYSKTITNHQQWVIRNCLWKDTSLYTSQKISLCKKRLISRSILSLIIQHRLCKSFRILNWAMKVPRIIMKISNRLHLKRNPMSSWRMLRSTNISLPFWRKREYLYFMLRQTRNETSGSTPSCTSSKEMKPKKNRRKFAKRSWKRKKSRNKIRRNKSRWMRPRKSFLENNLWKLYQISRKKKKSNCWRSMLKLMWKKRKKINLFPK